jgi:hypothetical protein
LGGFAAQITPKYPFPELRVLIKKSADMGYDWANIPEMD